MNRVLITGIGVTSPVGSGRDVFWNNLTAGRSGIGPITLFDASTLPVRIAGEVKGLDCRRLGEEFPDAIERDRKIWLGLDAAGQAVSDADLDERDLHDASLHVWSFLNRDNGLAFWLLRPNTRVSGSDEVSSLS